MENPLGWGGNFTGGAILPLSAPSTTATEGR